MKKTIKILTAAISATIAAVYLSGYGYIFKAIAMNLKKGSITPSTDDEEKFPSKIIPTVKPSPFQKDIAYNNYIISSKIANDLKKTRASSLVVIRDGKLLYEQYWKDSTFASLKNSFSMAKGILSILVGCAIDDGHLNSEDQLISSVFPEYSRSRYGKHLTFRHLMTMQAGLDWKEEYHHPFAENSKQYFVEDLAQQAFSINFKEMPGKRYEYQSVAAQLLGLALRKAIGRDLSGYLSDKIWKPMGMEFSAKWSTDEKGVEKAFCCIHATPRDFAKIGQMLMQNGRWNDKQIVSKAYCKRLLEPTAINDAFCFTIWADDENEIKSRFFYGFLGQFIIMIPERKMVIVKTGLYNRLDVDKKKRPLQVRLLVDEFSQTS